MKLKFCKMSGAGNDFVLLGGGNYSGPRLRKLAVKLCDRKNAVGADGLLNVRKLSKNAVSMRYFNSDGSEAFCGNGSRCSAWWAYGSGLIKSRKFLLSTISGLLPVEIVAREKVRMRMPDVPSVALGHRGKYPPPVGKLHFLNTGVPHAVVPLRNIGALDVDGLGRALRHNKAFGKPGTNVDFVELKGRTLHIRTYERGVEAETLACGTGVTASAVAMGIEKSLSCPVQVVTWSGEKFKVWFKAGPRNSAADIYIEGPAKLVFEGQLEL